MINLPKFNPGERLGASDLNSVVAELTRQNKLFAAPPLYLTSGQYGITLTVEQNEWWAVCCERLGPAQWFVNEVAADAQGRMRAIDGGRSGVAWDVNNRLSLTDAGVVVRIYPGFNSEYIFDGNKLGGRTTPCHEASSSSSDSSMSSESSDSSESSESSSSESNGSSESSSSSGEPVDCSCICPDNPLPHTLHVTITCNCPGSDSTPVTVDAVYDASYAQWLFSHFEESWIISMGLFCPCGGLDDPPANVGYVNGSTYCPGSGGTAYYGGTYNNFITLISCDPIHWTVTLGGGFTLDVTG